jgi:putative membrane protein
MGNESERARDHPAKERTYLAWVRTAVGIFVFGFAIGRFGLALRQFAALQGQTIRTTGLSMWFGSTSILFGVSIMVAAFVRYRHTRNQLNQNKFEASTGLIAVVALATTVFGIALMAYLLATERCFW